MMELTNDAREALKFARHLIANGHANSICFALTSVKNDLPHLTGACDRVKAYIQQQLSPHGTLGIWQQANGFAPRTWEELRRNRIAWIDWMLDEEDRKC